MTPLKLWWWRWRHPVETNFGDEISAVLLERITGRSVRWSRPEDADLIAAGSTLGIIQRDLPRLPEFWGTGFIRPHRDTIPPSVRPHAVRGRLTAQHFPSDLQEKMALGDPGVLANVLLDAPVRKKYSIGVIPHYKDIRHPAVTRLVNLGDDVRLIPVSWTPEEVVREVAACDVVLSSSLHGMVVADALGVPNAHLRLNESVGGVVKGRVHGLFKYRDYYSAYEVPRRYEPRYARDIFGVPRAELLSMVTETWDPPRGIDALREGLVASLPY